MLADPPAKPDKPADKPAADKPDKPDKPDKKPDGPDLSDFKAVEQAVTTRVSLAAPSAQGEPGYLGVDVEAGPNGNLVVADVPPDSPAAQADLQQRRRHHVRRGRQGRLGRRPAGAGPDQGARR